MIGKVNLVLESKKPVSQTGISWAFTTRTISNLVDNHSLHHTGGMCKDSLLIFQSFFNLPQNWLLRLSNASLRKESFAMIYEINPKHPKPIRIEQFNPLDMRVHLMVGCANITIICHDWDQFFALDEPEYLEKPDYIEAVKVARLYYDALKSLIWSYVSADFKNCDEEAEAHSEFYQLAFISSMISDLQGSLVEPPDTIKTDIQKGINRRMQKLSPNSGYVYLLQALIPQTHYKIGYSVNPVNRIESIGVKLPFPIKPIHVFPTDNARKAEKSLHLKYANKRVNGEWFNLSTDEVQAICNKSFMLVEVES